MAGPQVTKCPVFFRALNPGTWQGHIKSNWRTGNLWGFYLPVNPRK